MFSCSLKTRTEHDSVVTAELQTVCRLRNLVIDFGRIQLQHALPETLEFGSCNQHSPIGLRDGCDSLNDADRR